jgi:hypothetical protein
MRTSTKEIAKEIKSTIGQLKGVKLSVTSDYNHISVSLMTAPFQPIVNNEIVYSGYSQREDNTKKFDGHYGVNQYTFKENSNLTTDTKIVFALIDEIVKKYHWDKSDSMTDYFNCAFYYDYSVGQWDKPFKQI